MSQVKWIRSHWTGVQSQLTSGKGESRPSTVKNICFVRASKSRRDWADQARERVEWSCACARGLVLRTEEMSQYGKPFLLLFISRIRIV